MSITVRLTTGLDNFTGTAQADIVEFPSNVANAGAGDIVSLGAGVDTLVTERTSSLGLGADRLAGFTGLDVIDVTSAPDVTFKAYEFLLDQADAGTFTIRFDSDPLSLDLREAGGREGFVVDGTGQVSLSNGDLQWVAVADGVAGRIDGGDGVDVLIGGDSADVLRGGANDDSVSGLDGDDTLTGNSGYDVLLGGDGADDLDGGSEDDILSGGTGTNTSTGGFGADTFVLTAGETLTITDFEATNAYERIDLRALGASLAFNLNFTTDGDYSVLDLGGGTTLRVATAVAGQITRENFILPEDEDFISRAQGLSAMPDYRFTDSTDDFVGGAGQQIFDLSGVFSKLSGADTFDGGADLDTLRISGADRSLSEALVTGMQGIDVIDLSGATGSLGMSISSQMVDQSDDGALLIKNGANAMIVDAAFGDGVVTVEGTGEVTLRNAPDQNVTISDDYAGFVTGGSRSDKIIGGARGDLINGGLLDDALYGGGGDDTVNGDDGNDKLFGGEGNDLLNGGAGRDELTADFGSTTMTGGDGDDLFVIKKGAGPVVITDLDTLSFLERVDLTDIDTITQASDLVFTTSGSDVRMTADGLDVTLQGAQGANLDLRDVVLPGQDARVFNVDASTPIEELQNLIKGAPTGSTINLAAGVYDITETLWIDRSDITIKGAGEGQTILRMAQTNENAGQAILVQPDGQALFEDLSPIASDAAKGTFQITLSDDHELGLGDLLFIHQANDAQWLAETGNSEWDEPVSDRAEDTYLREFRSRITEIDGNTITLQEALPFTFEAGIATARQSTYLENVILSDFTVTGQWGETADPYNFEDTLDDAWKSIAAIELDAVENSSISRVSVVDAPSHAFRFQRTYEVTGDDLSAEGAHNKGPSNGYHYYFVEAFKTVINDATSQDARHSVLFSSFHAEHYNEIYVTETNRDINFHGSPDADNIVHVASMIQDYPLNQFPQWQAVNPGVQVEHPDATIEDNDVTFAYLESGERPDIVTAAETGGVLNTGIGSDQLFGGSSADILRGGANDDDMTGGGGRDKFVYRAGDGNDQIRDFEFGRNGDILVLEGFALGNIGDLVYTFDRGDLVVNLGLDASVRVKDATSAGKAHTNNVQFVSDPSVEGIVDKANADEMYILGTQSDDTITVSRQHVDSSAFTANLGAGRDTLDVEVGNVSQIIDNIGAFSGVDVFDFSISTQGNLALEVRQSVINQSDDGQITVKIGDTGDMRLNSSRIADQDDLIVDGSRIINLSDSGNMLTLGDRVGGVVSGGSGEDHIAGGTQNDVIDGGAGDDMIAGGAGADVLTGGAGSDSFIFEMPGSAQRGTDRITDFDAGVDRILIDVPDDIFPTGALPRGVLRLGTEALDRNDYLLYDQSSGELWVDLNTTKSGGLNLIATLDGAPVLDESDFFLI